MHQIQKLLLNRLLNTNGQRYASLTKGYDFDDNIVFHIKQLTTKELIKKRDSEYYITTKGMKHIAKYYFPTLEFKGNKTFFIGYLCEFENEVLIKEHIVGSAKFYNLPSGKPFFGEDLNKSLTRLFFEETNVAIKPNNFKYDSLHLKTVKTSRGDVLFDDAFAVYSVKVTQDDKKKMKMLRECKWYKKEDIKKLPNKWPEIDICVFRKNWKPHLVYSFTSDYILKREDL